ncbi:hypothetical protein GCM10011496_12940 [Polaromonas eurypsychrophila]|uniref:Uncharacterized protein n=1 Tax=Polaromonas eurypsychrophila TaxID=1614635 RepID=A0A916WFM1_9BURK|nr:hypothetical protein GCM10011496_12940 [Polaromonas eurypsychrophila]
MGRAASLISLIGLARISLIVLRVDPHWGGAPRQSQNNSPRIWTAERDKEMWAALQA